MFPSTSRTVYVGIDPGGSGGMAAIGDKWIETTRMPETVLEIYNWLHKAYNSAFSRFYVAMERITGFVGKYGREGGDTGSSMFKLGVSVGRLEMALCNFDPSPKFIMSHVWQEYLDMTPRYKVGKKYSESKPQFKKRLKEFAQKLFPEVKVTLYNCDALLIAEYLRRKKEGIRDE